MDENKWTILEEEMSIQELKNFVTYSLPKSLAYQTNRDTYCGYCFNNELQRHKAKQQLRSLVRLASQPPTTTLRDLIKLSNRFILIMNAALFWKVVIWL